MMILALSVINGEVYLFGNGRIQAKFPSVEMAKLVFPNVDWIV